MPAVGIVSTRMRERSKFFSDQQFKPRSRGFMRDPFIDNQLARHRPGRFWHHLSASDRFWHHLSTSGLIRVFLGKLI